MARRYYSRARGYASRGYGRARNYGGRARNAYRNQNAIKVNVRKEWAAGAALGLSNYDDRIPLAADDKLLLATMPVGGKLGGAIKGFFSGVCFGNGVQHKFGIGVNAEAGNTGDDTL